MRRVLSEKRAFGSSCQRLFCCSAAFDFFLLPRVAASVVVNPRLVLSFVIHHCVKAIVASGSPIRKPRCGTSRAEIAFPQRHVVSGITVNDGGKSIKTPNRPLSLVPAFENRSVHPMPPFRSTIK